MQLIGRDDELSLVRSALDVHARCVVVGVGGIGKSAVARQVADERRRAGEAVVWIDVEPLDTIEAVADSVARALGVEVLPDESSVDVASAAVADVRGLLVLDGVEHLAADTAAFVAPWSDAASRPGARVLVTSRVPLERIAPVVRLAALSMASEDPLSGAAGRMLVALAEAHGHRDLHHDALADIVRATGGLPLAVELAARQIARFGAAFAARNVGLVAEDAVVDRSVDRTLAMLGDHECQVFAALGWTAAAAEVELVAGLAGTDVRTTVTALGALADHGLVFTQGERFDLLPPIRDRASRLVDEPERLRSVVEWAAEAVVGDGRDEPSSHRLFDAHVDTFTHLAWLAIRSIDDATAATTGPPTARLLDAMYSPLSARMHVRDLIDLYTQFFAALDRTPVRLPPELEARTARHAAMATSEGRTNAAAEVWLDRAERAAACAQQPEALLGRIWSIRSVLDVDAGDLARAERLAHLAIDASAAAGERFYVEQSRRHLAEIALQRGELDDAERLIDELLGWARPNNVHHTVVATTFIGWIAVERGDRVRVAAVARGLRDELDEHIDYDAQVRVEADLMWLAADPGRLPLTPEWQGDATWWLRLEQRIRRAGALQIAEHWEAVMHTAADVLVLADTVPLMQPRLAAGLLLGDAALAGDDPAQARLAFGQVLHEGLRHGYRLRVADALDGLAVLAGRAGHDALAGRTVGAADRIRDRAGAQPWVRPSLPERWHAAAPVPDGWFRSGVDLVASAADEILRGLARPAPSSPAASLTRAERQVARLVAEGMSNAEIAAQLVVSRRTVESHLARIFRKLELKNRTQLARFPVTSDR